MYKHRENESGPTVFLQPQTYTNLYISGRVPTCDLPYRQQQLIIVR